MLGTRTSFARQWRLLAVLLPGLALVVGALTAPAPALAATGPALSLTGPPTAPRDAPVQLTARLTDTAGAAMGGQTVRLQRSDGVGGWSEVTTGSTAADGRVTLTAPLGATSTFRAVRDAVGDGTGDGAAATSPEVTVRAYDATTTLRLTGPASGYVDAPARLTATLTRADTSAPVAQAQVVLQRRVSGVWKDVQDLTTDEAGTAAASVSVQPSDNTFRAVYAGRFEGAPPSLDGSTSTTVAITPLKRSTTLTLTLPTRIVDETTVPLKLTWEAGNGAAVPGTVVVHRRLGAGDWKVYARVALGSDGLATLRVGPRVDSRWKAVGPEGRWWKADTSPVRTLDNVPPGIPVAYPEDAPRPAITLPKNARAKGAGPNARVSRISDAMWRSMVGRTWHRGCPVGRGSLRVVRVNYWGYDGYRYRGEIVLRDSVAAKGARVLSAIYRNRLPIWRMYRVDRFGWSSTLQGGNDYRSMRAGNTSGFNCRGVVGNPSVPSPHSYGRSIDINPWENPYRSRQGLVPNSWWHSRSHPRIAWRSRDHLMVRTMAANGFRWTYGTGDSHHFDG